MLSINTNLSSIIAQNNLKTSTERLNQAIERLSTGFKINHANDNAAGYSIANNMSTKLRAYEVASDNIKQGMDLVTTVGDTISLMQDKASRLRSLAVQARNGTYGAQSLEALNLEAEAIVAEINRTYNTSIANIGSENFTPQSPEEILEKTEILSAQSVENINNTLSNAGTYNGQGKTLEECAADNGGFICSVAQISVDTLTRHLTPV